MNKNLRVTMQSDINDKMKDVLEHIPWVNTTGCPKIKLSLGK